MGSYDGAECCELIVIYLLSQVKQNYGNVTGLYRDDGLAAFNEPPNVVDRIKKNICEIYKSNGLRITIEANKKVVNYLDVTLDFNRGTHRPYLKPGNTPIYVNTKSNHPQNVIRAIPKGINHRLSDISSNQDEFKKSTSIYQEALAKSGYNHKLEFEQNQPNQQRSGNHRNRKRNITWYNPPFDLRVKTNVGRQFLKIVNDSFPKGHVLQKIFNKNTLKLSYCCMPNMKSTIDAHNKAIMKGQHHEPEKKNCNCRKKEDCPLDGNCRSTYKIYQASVTSNTSRDTYAGLSSTEFKQRYGNHQQSFKKETYKNQTELSKYVWTQRTKKKKRNFQFNGNFKES